MERIYNAINNAREIWLEKFDAYYKNPKTFQYTKPILDESVAINYLYFLSRASCGDEEMPRDLRSVFEKLLNMEKINMKEQQHLLWVICEIYSSQYCINSIYKKEDIERVQGWIELFRRPNFVQNVARFITDGHIDNLLHFNMPLQVNQVVWTKDWSYYDMLDEIKSTVDVTAEKLLLKPSPYWPKILMWFDLEFRDPRYIDINLDPIKICELIFPQLQ